MTNEEQPVTQRIKAWLDTQGYPLEMRVARSFQEAGFRAVQSDYYVDTSSGQSREIDVIASAQEEIGKVTVRVSFVIECKVSRDKPWILFSSRQAGLAPPARVAQRAGNAMARRFLRRIASLRTAHELPLFSLPPTPAYGITQAFTSGADVCYAAAAAAASAANALSTRFDSYRGRDFLEIVYPVIVTEARIFEASLELDGSVALVEQRSGTLLWRNPLVGMPHTIINVVRADDLAAFAKMSSEEVSRFIELCRGEFNSHLADAVKDLRNKSVFDIVNSVVTKGGIGPPVERDLGWRLLET